MGEQRWLSYDGICTTLGISRKHARWLANQGILSVIWGPGRHLKHTRARFLDPTPEYKQKLVLAEAIYGRLFPIPKDIEMVNLLTTREVSEIMGWSLDYAATYLWKRGKSITVGKRHNAYGAGGTNLYSVKMVRELLWHRQDRKKGQRRNPFLISELIDYFRKHHAEESEEVPTDTMFREDDILMRKLNRLARTKDPEALRDFVEKSRLARKVAKKLSA